MNKMVYVRIAELVIAVVLIVLVISSFVMKAGESEIYKVEETKEDVVEAVENTAIEPVEAVGPTITHLVEIKKPVVEVPVEIDVADHEADPVVVVPGEPERTAKYFNVPLDEDLQDHIFAVFVCQLLLPQHFPKQTGLRLG